MNKPSHDTPSEGGNRQQLLFVCGCPRSGTTAMRHLLSGHPEACIGRERYARIFNSDQRLSENLFAKRRFLTWKPGDTFYGQASFDQYHADFAAKFDACRYVGDKVPCLYKRWNDIFSLRPQPIIIFMVRNLLDVAESYNTRARRDTDPWPATRVATDAVRDWNQSLRMVAQAISSGYGNRIEVIEFEAFFERNDRMLGLLSHFGLSTDAATTAYLDEIAATAKRLRRSKDALGALTLRQKRQLLLKTQVGQYRHMLDYATDWRSADFPDVHQADDGWDEAA